MFRWRFRLIGVIPAVGASRRPLGINDMIRMDTNIYVGTQAGLIAVKAVSMICVIHLL